MVKNTNQPNVLFLLCDQLAPQWLARAHTPHLDALAARGTTFQHAYCNSPICAPSRASLVTGRLPSEIGAYDNGADFPTDIPTFMQALNDAGYQTWLSGKAHFIGPDQHHGFQRRLTTDIYPASHVWTPDWNESPIHNPGTAVDQLQTAGLCKWNLQMDYDEETHFRALEALRDLARRPADPFFLNVSYTHPHDPFITTREWWDRYDHDAIPMPAAPAAPLEEHHPYDQWLQIHHMIDVYPPAEEDIRNARHAYLANISCLDHKIGELTTELDRLGLAENTVIVFTSDHGEMLGEHGMWFKRTWREASVRVPLTFSGPGIARNTTITGEASLLDLFPTFLELARVEGPDGLPGTSLFRDGREATALGEYLSEGTCHPMRYVVQNRLKYVHVHDTAPELLFDLATDPHETTNLIDTPAYADRLAHLRAALHENYDPATLRESVLASQQRRRALHTSGTPPWDVTPDINPANQYVRHQNAQATNDARRLD